MVHITPMFRQYLEIKEKYPDAILFFRLGDFYEMFFEDAELASRILDIALTSRDKGTKEKVPMCGVPAANAAPYINRLVSAGYKVAICEQVEDPKQAKGIVKREVIRVVTPGLNLDEETLTSKDNRFLVSLFPGKAWGMAHLDLSTGDFKVTEIHSEEEMLNELFRLEPKEILLPETLKDSALERKICELIPHIFISYRVFINAKQRAEELIKERYQVADLTGFGLSQAPAALCAAATLLDYVIETQKEVSSHLGVPKFYYLSQFLIIDEATKRNLEILRNNLDGSLKGSLLWVLDKTLTPMGGRLLKEWLLYPLRNLESIEARLEAVAYLVDEPSKRKNLRELLARIADVERLTGRAAMGVANPRDLLALKDSLKMVPQLKELLPEKISPLLDTIKENLLVPGDLVQNLEKTIREEAPVNFKEGGVIKDGVHEELDELRRLKDDALSFLAELETRERARTGIPNLKVGYNRVFGYYIEVSKSHLSKVPDNYIRKQTLVGGERFITPELKEFEAKVLSADERIKELEQELFLEIRKNVAEKAQELKKLARALATLDVLASLAEVAVTNNYIRPKIIEEPGIQIREGRHPVVEKALPSGSFVPNSVKLDLKENVVLVITGPNMAGKSTILRQTALITLLAHVGSFVPAEEATIGLCDRIFSRIGASDQLSRGRSTFMVEMSECANILHQATSRSLVILDEIGRGTSTYDGLAIAWAVAEFLHEKKIMTLFATHYHELVELAGEYPGIKNFNVAVKTFEDQIIFLYRLLPGPASESYGVQVAALAGLPKEVIARAKDILKSLENKTSPPLKAKKEKKRQKSLFSPDDILKRQILGIDPDRLSPLEALQKLYELKALAEKH
ncbi:DNA mismatch repair protein MutS [Thermodesulfatator indicus]